MTLLATIWQQCIIARGYSNNSTISLAATVQCLLCVCFAGYFHDIDGLNKQFKELNYEVTLEHNLNQADTRKQLDHLQARARVEAIHALVIIVLSHGEKVCARRTVSLAQIESNF